MGVLSLKKLIDLGLSSKKRLEKSKDVELDNFNISGHDYQGQVQRENKTYELGIDFSMGVMECSCPDYALRKGTICKHLLALLNKISEENIEDLDHFLKTIHRDGTFVPKYDDFPDYYVPSGCKAFDKMFGGGVPRGKISGVFGAPNTGKTILAHQIGAKVWDEFEEEIFYIDTERKLSGPEGRKYQKWMRERFDIPAFKINYFEAPKVKSLLDLFGWDLAIKYSELDENDEDPTETSGGKMDSLLIEKGDSKVREEFEEWDYGIIILDSATDPVEGIMGSDRSNFPGRYPINVRIGKCLRNIAVDYDVPAFMTAHLSKGASMYSSPDPKGGRGFGYGVPYWAYLLGGTKIGTRKFKRHRAPGFPKDTFKCKLKKNKGFY